MKKIKKFFKLEKRKLILTIVFSVWGFFGITLFNESFWNETFFSKFLLAIVSIGFEFFSMIPYNTTTLILEDLWYPSIGKGMMLIFFALLIIYNYVISCLILGIYYKVKKK
jgi:hypothetical protein